MQFLKSLILLLGFFTGLQLLASPPVPFSGKLAVDGTNFHGNALFSFSIVDQEGAVHWRHAEEQDSTIEIFVLNGRYVALLGGQGMLPLPADLFLKEKSLSLRVSVDLQDGQGMRLLSPDQQITSTPYALAAELAQLAERATIADAVKTGSITASMLQPALLEDLNRTTELGEITRDMLPQDVRNDLNATITRDRLSADVRADLNRTVRLQDLSPEVSQSINRTITLGDLDSQVITELNNSIAPGSISLDQLSQQVRDDINRTITKSMLSQEVLDELNASGGVAGGVPGSLIAVPANQSAPSGYELYQRGEPKELVWEEKAPVSVARWAYDGIVELGGKIYFVGGYNGSAMNLVESYDPSTDQWSTVQPMSQARYGSACSVLDGKIYAIGGLNLSTVEIYDPASDTWTSGTPLPSSTSFAGAITIDGKIFLVGGKNESEVRLNQVLCFDKDSNSWVTKASLPIAMDGTKLVYFEDKIWAIGAYTGSSTRDVFSYDLTSNLWQTEEQMVEGRSFNAVWINSGFIFSAGSFNTWSNSVEYYNPYLKSWKLLGSLPQNIGVTDAITLNDKVYIIGGGNGSTYSNKVFAADLNASVEGVHDLYVKTGDASSGTPTVQAEVADGSIGPSKLSLEVSNALKPVVVGQPISVVEVGGTTAYLSVGATGGDNTYQWKKNGVDIAGATSSTLSISDLNASQHEGNYTVVVSNSFGSATSSVAQIDVNGSLTEGLVGWWKFDETEGNIASDSSGNGNDGTLTNGPTWTEGKIGGALSFDGVDDFMNVNQNFFYNKSFSFSSWVKNSLNNKRILIHGSAWQLNQSLHLGFRENGTMGLYFAFYSNDLESTFTGVLDWSLFTFTFDNVSKKRASYANGNQVSFDISPSSYIGSGNLIIGKNSVTGSDYYIKILDDLRIYDRAISAVEVKALYELGEQPVQESGSGTATVVNGTVADGSITKSMLSQEVLDELNASGGVTGSVPGSLIAVPANQSAPSGYELYQRGEPKELVWEEKAPVSVARYAYDGVEFLDGKIYFVGGHDGSSAKNIAERYDPTTNTWETLANMSVAREGGAYAVLNGKLYAIGGKGLSSVEVFNPSNDSWSAGVALPSQVKYGTAITVDGKIFLIGGWNASNQNINQVLCFDPSTSQWIAKATMPTARHGAKLVWFENRIWVIGGNDGSPTDKVESYDPTTDAWQTEASLNGIRVWLVAWVSNGRIYAGGGHGGSSHLNSLEVYDPKIKQWTSAGYLPENKYAADSIVLYNTAFVISGQTSEGAWSNKVFAADLNASVEGVHDLYVKTGDASTGTPMVQAEVADGSITANQLSEQILKYLKPEITQQPTTAGTIFADTNHTISVSAEGKYLTYQWKKNGVNLTGETNVTLTITDANATQHDGNYSVVVSNDFGSVESGLASININSITSGLLAWWPFDGNAMDISGNARHATPQNSYSYTSGKINQAIRFVGLNGNTGGHATIPYFDEIQNSDLSISLWVKEEELHYFHGEYYIQIGSGLGIFNINPFGNESIDSSIVRSSWNHFTFTYDDSTRTGYLNGNSVSSGSWTRPTSTTFNFSAINKHWWEDGSQSSTRLTAQFDDVRIYNRALSATEVQYLYQLGQ
jgi:N-acetylneuraminic acid mutarotase